MELTSQSFEQACRDGGQHIETWLRVLDREHGASLYREAAVALGSWQRAEDVVQDALVKVWLRCSTFSGPANPLAWIRQIVRNTLIDALRAQRPETPLHDDEGELSPAALAAVQDLAEEAGGPPEALHEHQVEQTFRQCFDRFAKAHPDHATVLRWVVEEGLDMAEVSRLLDRSPGATREFVSQCRKKARPFFAPWYALVQGRGAS